MVKIGERIRVDGGLFTILRHDRERILANEHEGVPHVWHGVSRTGRSGMFASFTERYPKDNARYPRVRKIHTHKIG